MALDTKEARSKTTAKIFKHKYSLLFAAYNWNINYSNGKSALLQ
jgi:hypothetical protein